MGRFLREWREYFRGTDKYLKTKDVALEVGLEPSQLYKLEGDYMPSFWKWNARRQFDVLKAYDLPDVLIDEVSGKFNLEAAIYIKRETKSTPPMLTAKDLVAIRDLGTVEGGLKNKVSGYASDGHEYIEVLRSMLGKATPENCFHVKVTGDSMLCADAAKAIGEGSSAIFHIINDRVKPKEGKIVAVWLREQNRGIIKVYRQKGDYVILDSFNKSHPPIVLTPGEGIIQGVYVTHYHTDPSFL